MKRSTTKQKFFHKLSGRSNLYLVLNVYGGKKVTVYTRNIKKGTHLWYSNQEKDITFKWTYISRATGKHTIASQHQLNEACKAYVRCFWKDEVQNIQFLNMTAPYLQWFLLAGDKGKIHRHVLHRLFSDEGHTKLDQHQFVYYQKDVREQLPVIIKHNEQLDRTLQNKHVEEVAKWMHEKASSIVFSMLDKDHRKFFYNFISESLYGLRFCNASQDWCKDAIYIHNVDGEGINELEGSFYLNTKHHQSLNNTCEYNEPLFDTSHLNWYKTFVQRPLFVEAELMVAKTLAELTAQPAIPLNNAQVIAVSFTGKAVSNIKDAKERLSSFELTDKQREFLDRFETNNAVLLNGYAGCGKTHVIGKLLRFFPVGEIDTIHSLIWKAACVHVHKFKRDDIILIIDEASMVQTTLLASLIKGLKDGECRIVRFVVTGDQAQLPPLQINRIEGAFMRDLFAIKDDDLVCVTLDKILRQGDGSLISKNAERIRKGERGLKQGKEFVIQHNDLRLCKRNFGAILNIIKKSFCGFLETHAKEFQDAENVMAISYKNNHVKALNEVAVEHFFPPNKFTPHTYRGRPHDPDDILRYFQKGVRVVLRKNKSREGVYIYNGEIGTVVDIQDALHEDADSTISTSWITVDFGKKRKMVFHTIDEIERKEQLSLEKYLDKSWILGCAGTMLTLGYAITGHRSQGSTYGKVFVDPHCAYLSREWLYTAVTRASTFVHMVAFRKQTGEYIYENVPKAKIGKGLMGTMYFDYKKKKYIKE